MSHEIAVISDVHLLPETEEQISRLATHSVHFPREDTQPSKEELIARTGDADAVLISPGTSLSADYLQSCPNVKYIGLCGTSKENVDLEAVAQHNVVITSVVDYGDEPTAEFIFMQLVYLARGMGEYQWRDNPVELMGKSLGVIGLGALGKAVVHLAKAYNMDVSYYSRTRKPDIEQRGIKYLEKRELLAQSEILVITSPTNLTVIEKDDFAFIKPKSILIQASTGSCIDKEGFLEWVAKNGNFAIFDYVAGNDNYEAYKDLVRVIFPKVRAGHTLETRQRLGERVIANLRAYLEGV